jgi:hypothetical protein
MIALANSIGTYGAGGLELVERRRHDCWYVEYVVSCEEE